MTCCAIALEAALLAGTEGPRRGAATPMHGTPMQTMAASPPAIAGCRCKTGHLEALCRRPGRRSLEPSWPSIAMPWLSGGDWWRQARGRGQRWKPRAPILA